MRALLTFLLLLPLIAPTGWAGDPNTLTRDKIDDGWILLFDGETAFGWVNHASSEFEARDGMLVCDTGDEGWLGTTSQFADFILKLDYKVSGKGNSGVFLRAVPDGKPWVTGLEVQIDESSADWPTGSLIGVAKAAYPGDGPVGGDEQWNSLVVTAVGRTVQVVLNGILVTDARVPDERHRAMPRGHIGIQFHWPGMKASFRSIRLKPLGTAPIFNGKDLTNWKVVEPERYPSKYTVTDEGWLNVRYGGGDIQTVHQWQDFILQMDIISNGSHLNSGVFFRGDPGQFWSGYESQIRNQWDGDDRTRPVDFGTGGIYGRQPARRVVSSDGEWFRKTVVCERNHMAVWVDGYPVSDYTDTRERGMNARNNQRLEGGVISLQGHDPSTDLSFRRIEAGELPRRAAP